MAATDGLLGKTASGAAKGAALGPEGALVGAGLGLATGLIQNIQADKLKKQSASAAPELTDPNQAAFLAELNQKRKSLASGASYGAGMQQADLTQAATNQAIVNGAGGDSGATIQGLLQAQQVSGNIKNQTLVNGEQQQLAYDSAYGTQLNKIAARKMQLQYGEQQQRLAEWAKKKQFASQNANTGITGAAGLLSGLAGQPGATDSGEALPSMSGKPTSDALSTFMPSGGSAPSVTPQSNLSNQNLGALMSLL